MLSTGLDTEVLTESDCHVAGWGKTENGAQSPVILSTTVNIMSNAYCSSRRLEMYTTLTGEYSFCAGVKEGGRDSCDGDSGGPLYCRKGDRYELFGITSFGKDCAVKNQPGVYTKVANIVLWIKEHINGKLKIIVCSFIAQKSLMPLVH